MPRIVSDSRPINAQHPVAEFYREEFIKHHRCLQQHCPYFSESAITDVETALARIMAQIDRPRQGVMPAWESRLGDEAIKMLAVYVHSLGGGQ